MGAKCRERGHINSKARTYKFAGPGVLAKMYQRAVVRPHSGLAWATDGANSDHSGVGSTDIFRLF